MTLSDLERRNARDQISAANLRKYPFIPFDLERPNSAQ